MSVNNNKISSPIGLQEVYSLLGVSKTGTYYDLGYICGNTHGQTNPWALYKPERVNTPAEITLSQRKANNCGLTPYLVSTLGGLADAYQQHADDMHGWTYSAPRPGTDLCRLTDFEGYNHAARPPYDSLTAPENVALTQNTFQFTCMMAEPGTRTDMVNFSDLQGLGSLYFGIYITGTRTLFATNASPNTGSVQFSTSGLVAGTYTAYPFLSSVPQTQGASIQAGRFYTVPGIYPADFNVRSSSISIVITARKGSGTIPIITYTVSVYNYSGTTTLQNNRIFLRYGDKDFGDTMVNGEQYRDFDDVTVNAGNTVVANGNFTNIPDDLYANPRIWVSMGNGQYIGSAVPMMPTT